MKTRLFVHFCAALGALTLAVLLAHMQSEATPERAPEALDFSVFDEPPIIFQVTPEAVGGEEILICKYLQLQKEREERKSYPRP